MRIDKTNTLVCISVPSLLDNDKPESSLKARLFFVQFVYFAMCIALSGSREIVFLLEKQINCKCF